MEKQPAESHFHYGRTTFVQKAFYIGLGITAALAIHSCSPNTFNSMSQSYERMKDKGASLVDKVLEGNK